MGKPDRDVSEQRHAELLESWDEGASSANLALRGEVCQNAFDAKSLGTGGGHVIPVRPTGLYKEEGAAPLPPTRWQLEKGMKTERIQEERMKFPKQNNMGS